MATPRIYPRHAWGAREPKCATRRPLEQIKTVYAHYSDTHETIPSPSHVADVLVVQAIQRFHMDTRGYCDIAYGCLIGGNGDVYLGRPNEVVEAATFGHNREEWSICFLSDGPITVAQQEAFKFMFYLATITFPNVARRPVPHSAVYNTACPGDVIRRWLLTVYG